MKKTAIGAAIIKEGQLLIVKKKETFILPGGKPEGEESDIECMCREVGEELSGTQIKNPQYFNQFTGTSPNLGDELTLKVYRAEIDGELYDPSDEILELAWTNDPDKYPLAGPTRKVFDALVEQGYIHK